MYLLFDIGGTNTRLALVNPDDDPNTIEPLMFPTSKVFSEEVELIKKYIDENGKGEIKKVIGGMAGVTDSSTGLIINSPNLPEWNNMSIVSALKEAAGCDVIVENDAILAGLGEAVFGGGKPYEIVAYMTISTGIGGARIVNKMPDERNYGFEPGHQYIKTDFKTGEHVELESLISGRAIKKIYGQDPQNITDPLVWEEIHFYVSCGIYNTILFWSPDAIVLGGSTSSHLDIQKIQGHLNKFMKVIPEAPEIVKSELGHRNGILGAFHLLKQQYAE